MRPSAGPGPATTGTAVPPLQGPPAPRPRSPRALSRPEGEAVTEVLNSERFCDMAPAQVWATLLDEGTYLGSVSTMYRLLRARDQVRGAAAGRPPPRPSQARAGGHRRQPVWSWDITKLRGSYKWRWFHLYVILDVYSRYVPGWLVAPRESAAGRGADHHRHRRAGPDGPAHHPRRPGIVDDLQDRHPAARRPGRAAEPQAPAPVQRQPLLGGPVQDAQTFAHLSGPVREHPGGPGVLRGILRPLQPPPPSLGDRPAHSRRRPLRSGRAGACQPPARPGPGLCRSPPSLPPAGPSAVFWRGAVSDSPHPLARPENLSAERWA